MNRNDLTNEYVLNQPTLNMLVSIKELLKNNRTIINDDTLDLIVNQLELIINDCIHPKLASDIATKYDYDVV